jgi:hypothetical protein
LKVEINNKYNLFFEPVFINTGFFILIVTINTINHILILNNCFEGIIMSRKRYHQKLNIGWVIGAVGVGIVLTFIVPIWGWIIAVGAGLIFAGWYIIGNSHH